MLEGNIMIRMIVVSLLYLTASVSGYAQLRVSNLNGDEMLCYNPITGNYLGGAPFVAAGLGGLSRPHGILDNCFWWSMSLSFWPALNEGKIHTSFFD